MRCNWNRSRQVWAVFAVLMLFCTTAARAQIPPLVIPEGVGVNIHFVRGHEPDLDKIAAAGFKFIRMDFGWGGIERKKGEYDWTGYDELVRNLEQRKLRALFILDYSNPVYEETVTSKNPITGETHKTTASPQHPESVEAFARWAGEAVRHFKGRGIIWEIWNEPNIHFWSPKPDVAQYTALALATSKAVRQADPGSTLIGPATSGFPWDFLEGCFKAGLLQYWDAVSVHPYRDYKQSPETAAKDYKRLRELIDRYAPSGKANLPILSGEWGYASHEKGVSFLTQAAFAARQQMANVMQGVPVSIWYDWKNDGPDRSEREHNFGTVTTSLEPKPAYLYIQNLTRELAGFRYSRRLPLGGEQDYVLVWQNTTGDTKLALWTSGEPHNVQVTVRNPEKVSCRTSDGRSIAPGVRAGAVNLELDASPKYLTLAGAVLQD